MRSIEASKIESGRIMLAIWGVEGDRTPCLVWENPDPAAAVEFRRIKANKKLITAKTKQGLIRAGQRRGLPVEPYYYLPAT